MLPSNEIFRSDAWQIRPSSRAILMVTNSRTVVDKSIRNILSIRCDKNTRICILNRERMRER